MAPKTLRQLYPWLTTTPVIANAPMADFAGPKLAAAVHQAGGFGFIGAIVDPSSLRAALETASRELLQKDAPGPGETLPIGLGALMFYQTAKLPDLLALIADFRPAAFWLFAPNAEADYASWSEQIKKASPLTKIWIQVSSVKAALYAARECGADVIVLQGADAGGHGKTPGASVVSLVPEAADALTDAGYGGIPLIAAGGMADGRSVAAALAAGADGVVMGTAFLAAEECQVHPSYREAVLEAVDGGLSTVRSTVFDELPGKNIWPAGFDGRAIVADSYNDYVQGKGIDELRQLYKDAKAGKTLGFGPGERRAAIWAGSGIGLVKNVVPASVLLETTRAQAKKALETALARLG